MKLIGETVKCMLLRILCHNFLRSWRPLIKERPSLICFSTSLSRGKFSKIEGKKREPNSLCTFINFQRGFIDFQIEFIDF